MTALVYRLAGVALLCVVLTMLSDAFLTVPNLLNVLRQTALLFLIASGLTLVVLAGVAIARRVRSGQTPEEAVAGMTEEELSGIHLVGREAEATPAASDEPAPLAEAGDAPMAVETANNGRVSAR